MKTPRLQKGDGIEFLNTKRMNKIIYLFSIILFELQSHAQRGFNSIIKNSLLQRKVLLPTIGFICSIQISNGQSVIYNSSEPFAGTYSLYTFNLPTGLIADQGSNKFTSTLQFSGGTNRNYIYRINNYWYLGREITGGWAVTPFSADWKCPLATTDANPPCNCTWQAISTAFGSGGPPMKLFSGDCVVWPANMNNSTTLLPSGFVVSTSTTAIIEATPNPVTGTLIFDLTANCLKIYNGNAWVCV